MKIIEDFVIQYSREYDFYQKLSQIVASKIEDSLLNRGIRAMVTSRAKRPDRLKDKLFKRHPEKKYKTFEDIYKDIVDLAGVRISLYFPSDREVIGEVMQELFIIDEQKNFPESAEKPRYEKRFSGYWATHYRVNLKDEQQLKRYLGTRVEIQVASVLMHAWSEVEHDLIYKPYSGELPKEEMSILDEINGLVLSGEIALERLQSAIAERTGQSEKITNKYELTSLLINNKGSSKNHVKLGDTSGLNKLLTLNKSIDTKLLNTYLDDLRKTEIKSDDNEFTISGQLMDRLIASMSNEKKTDFSKYFEMQSLSEKEARISGKYIRLWRTAEEVIDYAISKNRDRNEGILIAFSRKISELKRQKIIDDFDEAEIQSARMLRNRLVHGNETPKFDEIEMRLQILKKLALKIVNSIEEQGLKLRFIREINSIDS